ncbi:dienelactone hydrolase family protein, partial [Patulibacter sp. NPDC049589]|uniref:dienelactone hydrolase family protein n=1 Tax=Patulibacter sp. NPDC049589 TaxID=3154731 RepID=UPI0034132BFB
MVLTETVEIATGDGPPMTGYLARPAVPSTSAVLVGMELFGVSAHVRDVCERLAEQGHVALAPDLYHRTAPGIE